MENLIAALEATLSPDQATREEAQAWLEHAKNSDKPSFMAGLANALVTVDYSSTARQQAGLQLKNCISGQHGLVREEEKQNWITVDENIRGHIKECALNTLGTEKSSPSTAAQVYAAVSTIEVPLQMWNDAVPTLLKRLEGKGVTEDLTVSVLEALGYLTGDISDIDPDVLQPFANQILTAVIGAVTTGNASAKIQTAAIRALSNSIEFCRGNFNSKDERDHIMMAVCNCTLSGDSKVIETALQCLVDIADVYYVFLQEYMGEALYPIMNTAMQSETTEIALQGVEFWTTVAEHELEIEEEVEKKLSSGFVPSDQVLNYCLAALEKLLPVLFRLLAQQEEEEDEDEWTVSKAAAVCYGLLSEVTKDNIVDPTCELVRENLGHDDWRFRDASVLAFGSILSGPTPEKLCGIVDQAALPVLQLIQDPFVVVQDSVAWITGRMLEMYPEIMLTPKHFSPTLDALGYSVSQAPRVASNACWSLSTLAEECFNMAFQNMDENAERPPIYLLSPHFSNIMGLLIQVSQRDDLHESGLRAACFAAIGSFVRYSAEDCYPFVVDVAHNILERLQATLSMQPETAEHYQHILAMQGHFCEVLQAAVTVMGVDDILTISDKLVMSAVEVLRAGGKDGNEAAEDAFGVISSLIRKMEKKFSPYFDAVKPVILEALHNTQHSQNCQAAVGTLSDLLLALQDRIKPYVQEFLGLLMEVVAVPDIDRTIKSQVVATFGDFAQAIGRDITYQLSSLMPVLRHACNSAVELESSDEDDITFINHFRESLLETYTNILQALTDDNAKSTPELMEIGEDITLVISFITELCKDPNLSYSCYRISAGFIGYFTKSFNLLVYKIDLQTDMAFLYSDCLRAFGPSIKNLLSEQLIQHVVSKGKESQDPSTIQTVDWMYNHYQKTV
eukprot:gene10695-2794_t